MRKVILLLALALTTQAQVYRFNIVYVRQSGAAIGQWPRFGGVGWSPSVDAVASTVFVSASTVIVTHNLNSSQVAVVCVDPLVMGAEKYHKPKDWTYTPGNTLNSVTITFDTPTTGRCFVK